MKHVIGNKSLVLIGLAESLTDLGNWVTVLACFALIVFRGGGSAGESGGILLALLVPALPVGPLAGWLSDRMDRKHLMIASKGLAALATVGLVLADRLELVYGALALQTALSALVVPPRQAAIFQLVAREDLSRANALLQQLSSLVKIAGPLLAGGILAVVAPQQAMIIDVVCLVGAGLLLTRLPALPPLRQANAAGQGNAEGSNPPPQPAPAGGPLAIFRTSPALCWLFAVMLVDSAIVATFDVLGSLFTRDALHGDETLYGTLISLVGVGAVGSTLFLLVVRRPARLWWDVVLGVGLFGVMPASFVLAGVGLGGPGSLLVPLLLGLGALLGGVANGLFGVQTSTLLQLLTPPWVLGRLEGLFQGTAVAGQLVAFLVTPLLVPALLSVPGLFVADTLMLILLALVLTLAFKQLGPEGAGQGTPPASAGSPVAALALAGDLAFAESDEAIS